MPIACLAEVRWFDFVFIFLEVFLEFTCQISFKNEVDILATPRQCLTTQIEKATNRVIVVAKRTLAQHNAFTFEICNNQKFKSACVVKMLLNNSHTYDLCNIYFFQFLALTFISSDILNLATLYYKI